MPWKSDSFLTVVMALLVTSLGSVAKSAYRVINGTPFSWPLFFMHLIVSAFAGVLTIFVCLHYEMGEAATGAACAIAGWTGPALIKIIEHRVLSGIGDHGK